MYETYLMYLIMGLHVPRTGVLEALKYRVEIVLPVSAVPKINSYLRAVSEQT